MQSHSACIQEDLLVLGQHNLTRSSRLLPTAHSSQDCRWAQIQGSWQEQAQARRSLRAPENSSSSFSAGMLLLIILPAPTSFQFLKCFPQSGMVLQTHVIPEGSSLQIQVLDTSSFCLDDNRSVAHPFLFITHFKDPRPVFPQTKSLQLITSYWPPIPGPQDFFFHPTILSEQMSENLSMKATKLAEPLTDASSHQSAWVQWHYLVFSAAWLRKKLAFCPSQPLALNCSMYLPTYLSPPHPWSCWELSLLTERQLAWGKEGWN